MVKFIGLVAVVLLLSACCKPQFNEYHILKRIKDDKVYNIPDSVYKVIDTLALYKKVKYKSVGDFFTPKEDEFIKFYSKGKMISYSSRIPLSKEYFRPARGVQGSYFINKGKLQCSFYNYPYGASGIINLKKDTLITVINRIDYYYVKINDVDPEWLNWKPDW